MYYSHYKKIFPQDILVYIEEFNSITSTVLFDFIDSNELSSFSQILNLVTDSNTPTMVLLKNYQGRTIREDTIYSIKPNVIHNWIEQISQNLDSFLIGFQIDVNNTKSEIFGSAVSINDFIDLEFNNYMSGGGNVNELPLKFTGRLQVVIRNVGQGNWNEIYFNEQVKIVFDAGGPMLASKNEIKGLLIIPNSQYPSTKPVLILSHWDKDHYHSLLGMNDQEIFQNFSAFICRNNTPNLTSRILFNRIKRIIGFKNIFSIPAEPNLGKGSSAKFKNLNPISSQIVLYNAQKHKNRNISGIALSVKSKDNNIILPGDAHYEQISKYILQHLNYTSNHYLIIPHHGGKAGRYQYEIPAKITLKEAIISVGTNRYKHPLESNIYLINKSGFNIIQTRIIKKDIVIKL